MNFIHIVSQYSFSRFRSKKQRFKFKVEFFLMLWFESKRIHDSSHKVLWFKSCSIHDSSQIKQRSILDFMERYDCSEALNMIRVTLGCDSSHVNFMIQVKSSRDKLQFSQKSWFESQIAHDSNQIIGHVDLSILICDSSNIR